jgi:putative alpha-1,2-mannosidase
MVAKAMGIDEDAAKYANRSRGFEYMWDPTTPILDDDGKEVKGIRGFMQVRRSHLLVVSSLLIHLSSSFGC